MKYLKQALAVMIVVSMLVSGMTGMAAASETADAGKTAKVSAQASADPEEGKKDSAAAKADVKDKKESSEAAAGEKDEKKSASDEADEKEGKDAAASRADEEDEKESSAAEADEKEGKDGAAAQADEEDEKESSAAEADEKEEKNTAADEGDGEEEKDPSVIEAEKDSDGGISADEESEEKDASEEADGDQEASPASETGESAEKDASADASEESESADSAEEADTAKGDGSAGEADTAEGADGSGDALSGTAGTDVSEITEGPDSENVAEEASDTMLPLEERKAYLVLHGIPDSELKQMPVTTMLEKMMDEDGKPISIPDDAEMVWAHYKDESGNVLTDEYHKISRDETVDLTDLKDAGVHRMEMIVGSGNQLDAGNIRYLVSVYFELNEVLKFDVYSQKNGTREKVGIEEKKFLKTTDSGYVDQNGKPIEGWAYFYGPDEVTSMGDLYIGISSSIEELPFVDIKVYDTLEVFANNGFNNVPDIAGDVMNQDMSKTGAGYHLNYHPQWNYSVAFGYFALIYDVAGIIDTQPVMFTLIHGYAEVVPELHTKNADNEKQSVTNRITNNISFQKNDDVEDSYDCLLLPGYSSEDTYQLSINVTSKDVDLSMKTESGEIKYYVSHVDGDNMNSAVTRAVEGNFTTVEEVMQQPDIKEQLLSEEGYSGKFAGDGVTFTLYFGGDWMPDAGELYRVKVSARDDDTDMKNYDDAPVVGSQDPWFRVTGLMLDGKELDTYVVENGKSINMDTYYGYGYQTIMVNQVLTQEETARLVPIFEVGDPDRVSIRLPGSEKALVSGKDEVDFSGEDQKSKDDDLANLVALIDGHTKNYQVRVISKNSGPKLYVYDDYTNEGGQRFREILLDDYFEEKHDILIANVGDETLTGLKVKLELEEGADHAKLDDYWTIGGEGNDTLEPFTSTEDLSTYGMIPNIAKIRLIPDGEGDIEGKITISADGQEDVVIYLSNHARQPEIINDEFRDAVKWVPYSYIVATNNMYDWNAQTFSISSGELPPGMDFNVETGEIYGAPDAAGEYTFTVKVTYSREDYFQPSEKEFTITVLDNEDETVYKTSDESYELIDEDEETGYIGERVSEYRFEISSDFDQDEVFISNGKYSNFVKVWLNGEELEPDEYSASEGSTRIVINRETLEEKSRRDGERNTVSAEFNENNERGDDLKRSSQNYYVEEPEEEDPETSEPASEESDDDDDDKSTEETDTEDSDKEDSDEDDAEEPSGNSSSGTSSTPSNEDNSNAADGSSGNENSTGKNTASDDGSAENSSTGNSATENGSTGNSSTGSGTSSGSSSGSSSSGGSSSGTSSGSSTSGGSSSTTSSGTVTINAKIVNAGGSPMTGLSVEMHSTVKTATTNGSGIAPFSGMEMGSHTVTVKNADGGTIASTGFTLVRGSAFSRNGSTITVVPGQTVNMTITVNGSDASITAVSAAGASNVTTGDSADPGKWAALLLAALAGVYLLRRMRKNIA